MKIGVVADDITGANDIGGLFAKHGYVVHVYAAEDFAVDFVAAYPPDVCIIDTHSRLDTPEQAYRKVVAATLKLQATGCTRFFNKTCSVFRGNIGAEFDAMLDALQTEFAVVVLGFPRNGRLTLHGVHYVHGMRLEDSPFRDDPIHPMRESHLVEILQAQTRRRVSHIDQAVVAQGMDALRTAIKREREHGGYCILDVADQEALSIIAHAIADEPIICGSSAVAEELPAVWGPSRAKAAETLSDFGVSGVLCVAGSLTPQTTAQIAFLREHGVLAQELATPLLFEHSTAQREAEQFIDIITTELCAGRPALVFTSNTLERVEATRAAGLACGMSATEVARHVTDTLANSVAHILQRTGGRRLIVAGGETSAAITRRLGIGGLQILEEIQPGVPLCVSLDANPMLLVLKSGSFGTPDFLLHALRTMKHD